MSSLLRAKPPGGGGGTPPLRGTLPRQEKPIRGAWLLLPPWRKNRATELVHHLRLAGHPCPLSELGSLQKKILGIKQEALQGAAREDPCPFL